MSEQSPRDPVAASENRKPSFRFDADIFKLCTRYLEENNYHGLALIARQKGLPPFLRLRIWPILLKHHPFVLNPFLQPDNDVLNKPKHDSDQGDRADGQLNDEDIRFKIKKDLKKYVQRLKYNSSPDINEIEMEMLEVLEKAIFKFVKKWGKIIKYDQAITWIALGLAEWLPPIENTHWVLIGRDVSSSDNLYITNIMDEYSTYIENVPDLEDYLNDVIASPQMKFSDVFERLVLVLLHSPENRTRSPSSKVNKTTLPLNGGTIEDRVSFFIYCLRKLLPELSDYFQEEQILNKFGSNDDEWLIWWLKWCGAKVWSRMDRGRIWDMILGWRLQNPKKSTAYYQDKLKLTKHQLEKLGPDVFWSVSQHDEDKVDEGEGHDEFKKSGSFKDLLHGLSMANISASSSNTNSPSESTSPLLTPTRRSSSSSTSLSEGIDDMNIPFSRLDPHIELVFISLALLKSKEGTLVELDQHEIRQFLSRLPTKSYNYTTRYQKYKQMKLEKEKEEDHGNGSVSSESSNGDGGSQIITNDHANSRRYDYMDNVVNEAGELWRKWFWSEAVENE
ncbi:Oxidant-induced cell-cycle arrest protein 5 [Meyerozyma sp. JA9]|nr:Oxidant-induced cell-cycle arrest protein 5 [Meyerozyma sp. JA9]